MLSPQAVLAWQSGAGIPKSGMPTINTCWVRYGVIVNTTPTPFVPPWFVVRRGFCVCSIAVSAWFETILAQFLDSLLSD